MFESDRPSWQNPKVLTTLIMVFVAGALTGALCMRVGLHERIHQTNTSAALNKPEHAKLFLDRCQHELDLTPEQTRQMSTILDDYKQYYENLQDQIEDVRATGKTRILALLNAEQRRKFEKLLLEMK